MTTKTIIKSEQSFFEQVRLLWQNRELFYVLAWRDVKVKYKQTALGITWAIIQPFLTMIVFTLFFGKIIGKEIDGVPYAIFSYSGLLFWNYFSNALSSASNSLMANQYLIQKVYFPRMIIPLASTAVHAIDFLFASSIFVILLIYYRFTPTAIGIALIIPCLVIMMLLFSGLGLFFSSVSVKYRDIRYALPFFVQLLLFVTPVIYPPTILGQYQFLWYLNPMSGVIETMRAGLLGQGTVPWPLLASALIISIIAFAIGAVYFNKTEKYFADLI